MLVEKYVWQFKNIYLHRPIKILHFLTPARIKKCFNITSKYISFSNNKPPSSGVAPITRDVITVMCVTQIRL